jgi:hypothetical protein
MSAWIPATLVIAIAAVMTATTADAGSCSQGNSRNCLNFPATLNFSSVPTISEQIVTEEHPVQTQLQTQQKLTTDPPASAPYTGPTFGTSLGRRAPTVGYQWSLE